MFLVSDIMTLQQIARRNFNLYYIQENLIELKAKQIAENKLMNEAEEFAEVSEGLSICYTLLLRMHSQLKVSRLCVWCLRQFFSITALQDIVY